MRFALQFHNVLIYVLLAAGFVTALMQHWIDAAVIVAVVVINAIIGLFNPTTSDAVKGGYDIGSLAKPGHSLPCSSRELCRRADGRPRRSTTQREEAPKGEAFCWDGS